MKSRVELNEVSRERCRLHVAHWGVDLKQITIIDRGDRPTISISFDPTNAVNMTMDDDRVYVEMLLNLREMGVRIVR
jgi:hypothetical protein